MSLDIDDAWKARWATDLTDLGLRAALIGNPRFGARIEQDLLAQEFKLRTEVDPDDGQTADVCARVEQINDEVLLRAGLFWFGPQLGTSLRPLASLPDIQATRWRLSVLMQGRDHALAHQVPKPLSVREVEYEGRLCLAAWLRSQPKTMAARIRLRLMPDMTAGKTDMFVDGVRVDAFTSALASRSEGTE